MHIDQSGKEQRHAVRSGVRPAYIRVLLITVILASLLGVFLWQQNEVANTRSQYENQIEVLESRIKALEKELKAGDEAPKKTTKEAPVITEAIRENIAAAVNTKNYAALESYFGDTVEVILAASEGIGSRTPAQVVNDLRYLDDGTTPWNFALSDEVLADWRAGDYARYLPTENIVIGRSANGYVVAFVFSDSGKVTNVFLTNSDELL